MPAQENVVFYDKFAAPARDMVFDKVDSFTDGLYGLYRRMELNPDALKRSIMEEFRDNDEGNWYQHYQYVVDEPARQQYPSSKGPAPGIKEDALGNDGDRQESERKKRPYTRDLGNDGMRLADFVARQPIKEHVDRLTVAEVAVLRLCIFAGARIASASRARMHALMHVLMHFAGTRGESRAPPILSCLCGCTQTPAPCSRSGTHGRAMQTRASRRPRLAKHRRAATAQCRR